VRASADLPWNTPVLVAELDAPGTDMSITLTADGLHALFHSNRIGGAGGHDLYRTGRPDRNSPWSPPVNVAELNTAADDGDPHLSADGLTVFFNSNRPGSKGGYDIYFATRNSLLGPFQAPLRIDELSTSVTEGNCALAPDGRLYMVRDLQAGGADMLVSKFTPSGSGTITVDHVKPNGRLFLAPGELWPNDFTDAVRTFDRAGNPLHNYLSGQANASRPAPVFNAAGNFMFSQLYLHNVIEMSAVGQLVRTFSGGGLSSPTGIAIDPAGNLAVGSWGTATVAFYDPVGHYLGAIGLSGGERPMCLAYDRETALPESSVRSQPKD
jgi:hypothetical protein